MKRCLYCLERFRGPGRCCCTDHSERVAKHVASVKAGRERAIARELRKLVAA